MIKISHHTMVTYYQVVGITVCSYLLYHYISLLPYACELFGDDMLYDKKLAPTFDIFPNILNYLDAELVVWIIIYLLNLYIFQIIYDKTDGYLSNKVIAFLIWYGWACTVNMNPLISNPGIPYVGWILLLLALMGTEITDDAVNVAWFLMALGYTVSGIHKLDSPSWIDGSALYHVLNSPLARDNWLHDLMVNQTWLLKMATWSSLFLEISFLPLGLFKYTKCLYWFAFLGLHLGVLLVINFVDLTLGVLMIHLLTFDRKWLKPFNLNLDFGCK
jgi:hypothetical protein